MTQQEMLDAQWSEDTSLFGFTNSDWYQDAKDMLSFGWMLNNADVIGANQQNELMYAVETDTNPNARYTDPRQLQQAPQNAAGVDSKYLIWGGVAVLAYLVLK